MSRGFICSLALFTTTISAFADPKVDSAISVFKQTEADAAKLVTFCAMSQAMEAAGENEDPATKAEIDEDLKQLGPEFEAAWKVFRETDQNSPEGRALNQAVDELGGDCPD
jgi:hypothetical protein